MADLITIDEAEAIVRARLPDLRLIAIDGLPCAGKTTLTQRLMERLGLQAFWIDSFYLHPDQWPADVKPAYPFPFFRNADIHAALHDLHRTGRCVFNPFDWDADRISETPEELVATGPVIVEGVSSLDPALVGLYDLRFFIESDGTTLRETQKARDGDADAIWWETLYLPSDDIYMAGNPQDRADFLIAGRGIG